MKSPESWSIAVLKSASATFSCDRLTFCGSDHGGQRTAILYTHMQTCLLNDVDPQAWLADVLARTAGHCASDNEELLPWNWRKDLGLLSMAA